MSEGIFSEISTFDLLLSISSFEFFKRRTTNKWIIQELVIQEVMSSKFIWIQMENAFDRKDAVSFKYPRYSLGCAPMIFSSQI